MKYLKRFNESNSNLVKSIEEAFYNISDKLNVDVLIGGSGVFTTTTEYNYGSYITNKLCSNITEYNLVRVSIYSEKAFSINPIISDYDDIKDDLKFAVDYLTNELNLSLIGIFIYNEQNNIHYKKNLKNIETGYFRSMNIYFVIQKSVQNLV